ncbi:hypothetical protein GOP47_0001820 [Adiantum capillus-veneris]|uniref:Cytochrome P450 n=1 Tax=Adiantum capillus-veneris TaxID=13818 RepID=A0A9D4VAT8_ADICA|nr:hypothetical protein GOP47_0001820 [Adiantum capillus-veneris]
MIASLQALLVHGPLSVTCPCLVPAARIMSSPALLAASAPSLASASAPSVPSSSATPILPRSSIVLASYNPQWVILRKLCTLELFTANRLQALQHVRYEEVRNLLQSLIQESRNGTQAVELGEAFIVMNAESLSRVLHSKTLAERRKLMKTSKADDLPKDLLQVLLSREETDQRTCGDQSELLSIKEIKGTILEVLSAGILTTALTLEWAMAELFRNPRCLKKLQHEIDDIMAKEDDHFITDEDISKLPYLEKVVKEVLRLHPAVPLMFPHVANEAVKLDKYTLSAGTLVYVNVWAIGRDPDVWENAEEFFPERFDGKDLDVKGQHYDLLPLDQGGGTFEWELPDGQTHVDVDMSEQRGISSIRTMPLLAIPKPLQLAPLALGGRPR